MCLVVKTTLFKNKKCLNFDHFFEIFFTIMYLSRILKLLWIIYIDCRMALSSITLASQQTNTKTQKSIFGIFFFNFLLNCLILVETILPISIQVWKKGFSKHKIYSLFVLRYTILGIREFPVGLCAMNLNCHHQ